MFYIIIQYAYCQPYIPFPTNRAYIIALTHCDIQSITENQNCPIAICILCRTRKIGLNTPSFSREGNDHFIVYERGTIAAWNELGYSTQTTTIFPSWHHCSITREPYHLLCNCSTML